ncbi:MAG: hypothetical protein KC609_00755, partial [Myxococcales bacterium]|nr:hypothetical protein [Myxococcales bacterium]
REVLCRLEEEPRTAERAEIERALSGFLEKIEGHPAPAEVLLDLIGVAMKKYPLDQEPTRSWGPWVAALLDALSAVSALDVAGLRADERLQLFRIFPRIADCDCRTALAIFVALVERRAAEGDTATAIAGELRHLKLRNRHVQRAHFDGASEVLQ